MHLARLPRTPQPARESDAARSLTGALEGSILLARSYSDPARFEAAVEQVLNELEPLDEPRLDTQ